MLSPLLPMFYYYVRTCLLRAIHQNWRRSSTNIADVLVREGTGFLIGTTDFDADVDLMFKNIF